MTVYTGYIEGYYGKILTWQERSYLIDHFPSLKLNTYIYAPKEDPYHRQLWKISYPKDWLDSFTLLVTQAKRKKIKLIPAMAPGLSYNYTSKKDYLILLNKFLVWCACGCSELALLMDDIPCTLPKNCTPDFSSLGHAHAELLKKLSADISKKYPKIKFLFCPTVYSDQMAETKKAEESVYLKDLAAHIPHSIPLFWTGHKIVSPHITNSSISYVQKIFKNRIIIWDNFYANDYCPQKIFLGAFTGRNKNILPDLAGFMINPTGLFHTDLFYLKLMSAFLQGKAPLKAWNEIAKESAFPSEIKKILPYFGSPFFIYPTKIPTNKNLILLKKSLFKLLWQWKHPLHQEWYSFLHALDTNVALMHQSSNQSPEWIAKKLTPLHAFLIRNKQ